MTSFSEGARVNQRVVDPRANPLITGTANWARSRADRDGVNRGAFL